jgi:DNA topoisomerase-1
LQEFEIFDTEAERKKAVLRAIEKVAKHLGNTPAICRSCYIHPAVLDGYLDGSLLKSLAEETRKYLAENIEGMSAEEAAVTAFLRVRLAELTEQNASSREAA